MYSKSLVKVYSILDAQSKEEMIKNILLAAGYYYDAAVRLADKIIKRFNPSKLDLEHILKLAQTIEHGY